MTDREKAIKGLEHCGQPTECDGCPYDSEVGGCFTKLKEDALALLKEQDDIVKCKMCKYWEDTSEGRYIGGWCFCDRLKFSTSPEWYCADGEVKTDAAD